jgi:hypothetical protein
MMRKLFRASTLTLILAIPAWAGDMGCPAAPPSGGREAQSSSEPTKAGNIGCPVATEVALTLLRSLLTLF